LPSTSEASSVSTSPSPDGHGLLQHRVSHGLELLALGDEVGLAVDLDQDSDAALDVDRHQAVARVAALALGDALLALDPEDLFGLDQVAVRLVEGLLDVHHPGAGLLAQGPDVGGRVVRHGRAPSVRDEPDADGGHRPRG
jgi:hypothetical protein